MIYAAKSYQSRRSLCCMHALLPSSCCYSYSIAAAPANPDPPPPHTLARRDWQTMTHTSTAGYDKGKTVLKLDNQPHW